MFNTGKKQVSKKNKNTHNPRTMIFQLLGSMKNIFHREIFQKKDVFSLNFIDSHFKESWPDKYMWKNTLPHLQNSFHIVFNFMYVYGLFYLYFYGQFQYFHSTGLLLIRVLGLFF